MEYNMAQRPYRLFAKIISLNHRHRYHHRTICVLMYLTLIFPWINITAVITLFTKIISLNKHLINLDVTTVLDTKSIFIDQIMLMSSWKSMDQAP